MSPDVIDLESRDHSQRGRLAAAGRSEEGDELPFGHFEVEVDNGGSATVIDFPDTDEFEIVATRHFAFLSR